MAAFFLSGAPAKQGVRVSRVVLIPIRRQNFTTESEQGGVFITEKRSDVLTWRLKLVRYTFKYVNT